MRKGHLAGLQQSSWDHAAAGRFHLQAVMHGTCWAVLLWTCCAGWNACTLPTPTQPPSPVPTPRNISLIFSGPNICQAAVYSGYKASTPDSAQ